MSDTNMNVTAAGDNHRLSEAECRELVRRIIIELAPNATVDITADAHLVDSLGYHSLALLELAFALEDEFNLSPIDEQTARKILTVRDVENHVVNELAAGNRFAEV